MPSSEPVTLSRDCEAIEIPSGAPKTLSSGTVIRIMQSRGGSFTVSANTGAMYRIDSKDADALGLSSSGNSSVIEGPLTEQIVIDQLKSIFDPEIPVNIVDLGLVYGCTIRGLENQGKRIVVKLTMTAPGCGMGNVLRADVEQRLARLPEVSEVEVEVVFDPPWHPGRMSEAARLQLGLDLDEQASSPFPVFPTER